MLGKSGAGVGGVQSAPGPLRVRTMLPLSCVALLATVAAAAAAPATYDQRQDGDFNVRADVQNVLLLVAVPEKMSIPSSVFDGFLKNSKQNVHDFQERADVRVMEAFVEPSTPYHVEIGGGSGPDEDGDGRAVEVVIAGRRRFETEPFLEAGEQSENSDTDELKLIGATEQCGPDRERDPDTLTCREIAPQPQTQPAPVQPSPTQESVTPEDNLQDLAQQNTPQVIPVSA